MKGTWPTFPIEPVSCTERRQGVGMVPLDDVYRYQCERFAESGMAGLRTDKFGLDKKGSYTVEWAVYPTASGDYYRFSQRRPDARKDSTSLGWMARSPSRPGTRC